MTMFRNGVLILILFCLIGTANYVTAQPTKCQMEATDGSPVPGKYIPQCTETGEYEALQCHGSTGYCWCVNENGEKLNGTEVGPGEARPNCTVELTMCQRAYKEATERQVVGNYIPQCTAMGEYEMTQCHGSTGYCWCVNENGTELVGTRVGRGEPRPNCDVELTMCQRAYKEATERQVVGNYIPQCTAMGEYEMTQCHGSTGYCWCVNENGEELVGTRVGRGEPQPNCDDETLGEGSATSIRPILLMLGLLLLPLYL